MSMGRIQPIAAQRVPVPVPVPGSIHCRSASNKRECSIFPNAGAVYLVHKWFYFIILSIFFHEFYIRIYEYNN